MSLLEIRETIVSDDSTSDATKTMISSEFPQVIYLRGPRKGLGYNRNRALSAVTGDIVAFLDDDATLDSNFFSHAFEFAAKNDIDLRQTILTGTEINQGETVRSKDQDFLGFQKREYGLTDEINTLVINSAIIPSSLAKKIEFDEFLVYGSDEVDFAIRARSQGIKIVFCPDLKNHHFPSPVNREYYSPFTDASRIYVTFKRYIIFEQNFPKAALFIVVAPIHLIAACIKRSGLKGISSAAASLKKAFGFIFMFLVKRDHVPERSDS
jgi:GT2 family glycosyltransferase